MYTFKTESNLSTSEINLLTNFIDAIKTAKTVSTDMDAKLYVNTPEVTNMISLAKQPELIQLLNTKKFLLAEVMLHAELKMNHEITNIIGHFTGHYDKNKKHTIVPFPDNIRLLFLHTCVYDDKADITTGKNQDQIVTYFSQPVEHRSKDQRRVLSANELVDYFIVNNAMPASQSSDNDYLTMIKIAIDTNRIKDIATIQDPNFTRVQLSNEKLVRDWIYKKRFNDGANQALAILNDKNNILTEEKISAFIITSIKKNDASNHGYFSAAAQHSQMSNWIMTHIHALLDLAKQHKNTYVERILDSVIVSLTPAAPTVTTQFERSKQATQAQPEDSNVSALRKRFENL